MCQSEQLSTADLLVVVVMMMMMIVPLVHLIPLIEFPKHLHGNFRACFILRNSISLYVRVIISDSKHLK
jgi:hypothetical protein